MYGYEYREMKWIRKKFADLRWSLVNSRSKHKLCEVSSSYRITKLLTNSRAFEIIQSAATLFPAYAVICRGGRAHISVVYPFNSMNGDNRNEFLLFYASLRWMWIYTEVYWYFVHWPHVAIRLVSYQGRYIFRKSQY